MSIRRLPNLAITLKQILGYWERLVEELHARLIDLQYVKKGLQHPLHPCMESERTIHVCKYTILLWMLWGEKTLAIVSSVHNESNHSSPTPDLLRKYWDSLIEETTTITQCRCLSTYCECNHQVPELDCCRVYYINLLFLLSFSVQKTPKAGDSSIHALQSSSSSKRKIGSEMEGERVNLPLNKNLYTLQSKRTLEVGY